MVNTELGVNNTLGVRSVGSSNNRYVTVHGPSNTTGNAVTMLAKVDASNQIQTYTSDLANTAIYLVGYWSVAPEE